MKLSDLYKEYGEGKKKKPRYTRTKDPMEVDQDLQFSTRMEIAPNGGIICYNDSYREVLQSICGAESIFADFETGSYDPKKDSLNPWHNCWPIGLAICCGLYDDYNIGPAYYIPIDKDNEQEVYRLLYNIFNHPNCKRWINHNIKYDAQVLYNSACIEVPYHVDIVDTLTLAKLIDSERFQHGLDVLSRDWLNQDIAEYEAALKPYKYKNKDYSAIPIDVIGPYACQDVLTNRKLYKYICDNLPQECNYVRDIEIYLTRVLIEIEQNGLRVKPEDLLVTEALNYKRLIEIEEELEKITGKSFRPHTNADCFDVLINYYGLPILKWTNQDEINEDGEDEIADTSNCRASFDKHAMVAYLSHPIVLSNPDILQTVKLISEYRKIHTFQNLFINKYKELIVGDILHPFYNQCVRSGRMSCSKPNAQQLNKSAKQLIIPYASNASNASNENSEVNEKFVSYDFSQIEYRTIAHYIENPLLLEKYNNDPDADFHEFVAQLVKEATNLEGMTRGPAKTLNFGLGFNMGKAKLLKSLKGNLDLMASLIKEIEELIEGGLLTKEDFEVVFNREAEKRAELVWNTYHLTFPEMKATSRKAQAVCEKRGYIINLYGRRRHLDYRFAYKAFNTINQSSAADLMKDAMVRVHKDLLQPVYNVTGNRIIRITADVHDEMLFSMPASLANDTRITHTIAYYMENPIFPPYSDGTEKKLKVPIRVACGIGDNWREAVVNAKVQNYNNRVSKEEFVEVCIKHDS